MTVPVLVVMLAAWPHRSNLTSWHAGVRKMLPLILVILAELAARARCATL
jgi:uncharacterized membrane protein